MLARSFIIAVSVGALSLQSSAAQRNNFTIYNHGDYSNAALSALQIVENLTDTLVGIPSGQMINSSDTIMAQLKTVYASLDTLGAPGFAYAFQDRIVALYDQDEYVFRTARKLQSIQDEHNSYISSIFTANIDTPGCAQIFNGALTTVWNAYDALQYFFENQYIGNTDNIRDRFYQTCDNNVCYNALHQLMSMISGDGSSCDLIQVAYDGQFNLQPFNY